MIPTYTLSADDPGALQTLAHLRHLRRIKELPRQPELEEAFAAFREHLDKREPPPVYVSKIKPKDPKERARK